MNTRQLITSALAVATLTACGGGSNDQDRWSLSVSEASRALARPGSAVQSADATGLTLTGGDGSSAQADAAACAGGQYGFATGPCRVVATGSDGTVRGSVSFEWTYTTRDTSGPGADLFGMIVDGTVVPLSDPGGSLVQSGRRTVNVARSLGWYINCTDCTQGEAEARITSITVR